MPFPALLVWGTVVATTAFGVKKSVDAVKTSNRADNVNKEARDIIDESSRKTDAARKRSHDAIETLGKTKINALDNIVKPFIEEFRKVRNISFRNTDGLSELNKLMLDKNDVAELQKLTTVASSLASGTLAGGSLGAVAAFGAYNGVMLLGTASTGTAIGTLSGAAATNATLAWLGGGSLAAGGLGVTGGMCVLGGVVAAPVLAVMGCVMNSKANRKLEEARENRAQAREYQEQMRIAEKLCNNIEDRADMFTELLKTLQELMASRLSEIIRVMQRNHYDYKSFRNQDRENLMCCTALVKTIKTILDTPILTREGNLAEESSRVATEAQNVIARFN